MQDPIDTKVDRRTVVAGAAGLAVGALGVGSAQAQAPALWGDPVDPENLASVAEASHASQNSCTEVLRLAVEQLALGNLKMVGCIETTTNMLVLATAIHTIATHGHAHPKTIRALATAAHQASSDCADECEKWDHPIYKAGVAAARKVAEHAEPIMVVI